MKMLQKWLVIAGVMFVCNVPAADTGPSVTYVGTVVNAQGQPVSNAEVDFYQYPARINFASLDLVSKQHAMTDGKGAFSFSSAQAMTMAVVKKAGFAPAWKTWNSAPEAAPEALVLTAPTTLAGIVVDEKGQLVPNADVWVSMAVAKAESEMGWSPNILFGKPARECFFARTSADGRFRMANFPAGAQGNLAVGKTGKALRSVAGNSGDMGMMLPYESGQEDIKLVLDPAGSIEGRVTVRETGQALPGVKLRLQPSGGFYALEPPEAVSSGTDGTFRITDVAAGPYLLAAVFERQPLADWVTENVPVTVKAGETARDFQVQASKGGVLEVTVLTKDDQKTIANISVSAYGQSYQTSGSTGTNGVSLLRLPPGQFTVIAMKEGRSSAQVASIITAGQTNRVRLELNPPLKITGTVRDPSGAPVAGARMAVQPNYGGGNVEIKTDANGHYEVTWQQPQWEGMGNQRFFLVARSLDRNLAAVREVDAKTTALDLNLKPGMTVSARVEDANGNAITNVTGYLMLHTENYGFSLNNQPIKADDHGRIQIDALPLGERYGMNVLAKGYGSANQQMETADPKADHYEFPPFVLKLADRKLAGRVLGTDGKPVAGAQVNIQGGANGEGQPQGYTRSDTDGRFAFDAVCEGPVSLWANLQNSSGNAQASGGDTNVVIRLGANNNRANTPSLTMTGTVLDPSGTPAPGVSMVVTPAFGMMRGEVKTDANGQYKLDWQPERMGPNSKYFLIARDLDRNLAVAQEINDKLTNVDLRLQSGFSLSGTVQDASGAPLNRAGVNLNFMAGNNGGMVDQRPVQTDAQGGFTIAALPTGQRYSVRVSATGYGTVSKQVSQAETQNGNVELPPFKLKLANLQLAGQVVGTDDKPVAGAQVMVNGQGQPNSNTRTDADGHFNLKVCDGPLTIIAFNPQGGSSQGNVQARGGDTNVVVKMGARQLARNTQSRPRTTPLKERPWTWSALTHWLDTHKTARTVLISGQIAILAGTVGGIFWITRKRRS